MRTRRRALRPTMDQLDERCLLSGYTPAQMSQAYGLGAITFPTSSGSVKGDGSGQTIALVEAYHDPTIASDLQIFDQTYNLPDPALNVVNLGVTQANAGWALEESLDVEWAHAVAPGANILVVEARSQGRQNLLAAVDVARNTPGVVAVSMSWGFGEVAGESSTHFTTPAGHTGITFVAASGDGGAIGGTEWPAVSPNVLSVGATSLITDAAGNYRSEVAWVSSGGGYSRFLAEPTYQKSIQSTGRRVTPDVALNGDPNTGVEVYETSLYSGRGSWQVVGGTSLATPAWAAIIAIVDQGRALEGKASLDGPTQTLPALYALPSTDFHTIPSSRGGVNTATGLGTPNGPSLVADLVASNLTQPLRTFSRARNVSLHRFQASRHRPASLGSHPRASHAAVAIQGVGRPHHHPSTVALEQLAGHPGHRVIGRPV